MFLAIFFLFLNTGPSNTALANVSLPAVRATAFAVNIFRHPRVRRRAGILAAWLHRRSHEHARGVSVCVRNNFLLSGLAWLIGVKYLPADTAAVETAGNN